MDQLKIQTRVQPPSLAPSKAALWRHEHKEPIATLLKAAAASESHNASQKPSRRERSSSKVPSLIIFDLDGCLWRPEMYELLYFSGGAGAPFTYSPNYDQDGTLYTRANEPVRLLGQVRDVMRELYNDQETWGQTQIGISSRTDQPEWAMELLEKFTITTTSSSSTSSSSSKPTATTTTSFAMKDVFQGPIEIGGGSKVGHFERIAKKTGVAMSDMLFFDNERGNCNDVSKLGVAVAYCPDGVTQSIWNKALDAFPESSGKVIADENTYYGDGYQRTQW